MATYKQGEIRDAADNIIRAGTWGRMTPYKDLVNIFAENFTAMFEGGIANAGTLGGKSLAEVYGYTDSKIANLVSSSPATLDTLNELASALGNDANFSTTMMNLIGTKAPGGYGEGSTYAPLINDLHTITINGKYWCSNTSLNIPANDFFWINAIVSDANNCVLEATSFNLGVRYTQKKLNGAWSAWKQVITKDVSDGLYSPKGFGTGEFVVNNTLLSPNTNVASGMFYCQASADNPSGTDQDLQLLNMAYSTDYSAQIGMDYTGAEHTPRMFFRNKFAGAYKPWEQVMTKKITDSLYAPRGYGLGNVATAFNVDFNSMFTTGFFSTQNVGLANAPEATNNFFLTVMSFRDNMPYATQTAVTVGAGTIYQRVCGNGVWSPWIQIITANNPMFTSGVQIGNFAKGSHSLTVDAGIMLQTPGLDVASGSAGIWFTPTGGNTYEGFNWQLGTDFSANMYVGNGGAWAKCLTVLPNGNMGLKNPNPLTGLHVGQDGGWTGTSGVTAQGINPGFVLLDTQASPQKWAIISGVGTANNGIFGIHNATLAQTAMVIAPSNNYVGIGGVLSPKSALDINGGITATGSIIHNGSLLGSTYVTDLATSITADGVYLVHMKTCANQNTAQANYGTYLFIKDANGVSFLQQLQLTNGSASGSISSSGSTITTTVSGTYNIYLHYHKLFDAIA